VATTIHLPKLGVAMSEGILVEWLVDDGATIEAGQPLYRLETEKVENDVESPAAGVIRLLGVAGETYPVGAVIAEIG
jgi:pyruvate dehydrogenase E2 component (dihydrolipoamide acetyltransferase)/2-oxoglutarate dehydrogenase E2 component (dihydrolipoamide succinyltransferase)